MQVKNFWLEKKNERNILKVIEWAHRKGILIEDLKPKEIIEAMKAYIRDSSHS